MTLVRNPYYLKVVDPKVTSCPKSTAARLGECRRRDAPCSRWWTREIDYQDRHINANANRAVFIDAAPTADIHLVDGPNADMNTTIVSLNLTTRTRSSTRTTHNKDFRIGLSYAIDRKAIIDSAFVGQGEPWQAAPRPRCALLQRAPAATQYTEYDVANQRALDKAYPKKDAENFRLGPDGKPSPSTSW